jgi:hypothetical protein
LILSAREWDIGMKALILLTFDSDWKKKNRRWSKKIKNL